MGVGSAVDEDRRGRAGSRDGRILLDSLKMLQRM